MTGTPEGEEPDTMGKHRWPIKAGVALCALSLAAACGGSSGGSSGSSPGASSSGSSTQGAQGYNAAIDGVRNPSDTKGGTLQMVATADVDSLDPARAYYGYVWNLMRLFTRTLVAYDAKPGEAGNKVVPDLATDLGKSENNGQKWTYTLKPGVKFEDGTPITSKDIKYGIERIFAQDVISGGPTYAVTFLDDPKNPYPGPYKDKDPNKLGLKSIVTPDDNTIVFNLNKPFTDWPYILATPGAAPVPKAIDQGPKGGSKYAFNPVSSGPYKVATYQPGKLIKWVRNTNWDPSTDTVRKALADEVVMTEGLSADDLDKRIIANEADVAPEATGVQVAQQAQILRDPALKARSDNPSTIYTRYIAISGTVAPLNNIHCRMAVQYAADKVALQGARGGPIGGGDIATNMSPPSLVGFQKFEPFPDGPDHKGDLAKAKSELAACGQPNGFTTNIATTNKGKGPPVAEALQAGLARVGIKTNIIQRDASAYYSEFVGSPNSVLDNKLGLMVAGWGFDFPTPYGFYESIVDSRQIKPKGNSNYSEIRSPQVDKLLDEVTATTDETKIKDLSLQLDKAVMATAQLMPFLWDKSLQVTSSRLKNVYIQRGLGATYDFVNLGVQ